MSEWRPVRIAPIAMVNKLCRMDWLEDEHPWPEGKIVRVRKIAYPIEGNDGPFAFEIHPDDDFEPKGCPLCEHQILAD